MRVTPPPISLPMYYNSKIAFSQTTLLITHDLLNLFQPREPNGYQIKWYTCTWEEVEQPSQIQD